MSAVGEMLKNCKSISVDTGYHNVVALRKDFELINDFIIEAFMKSEEFALLRKRMKKTQKQMAKLLGVSVKAIHSYEQGWRSIPVHIERQFFFLLSKKNDQAVDCWALLDCPEERKEKCPAWEFNAGKHCWFINGTICEGESQVSWREKMVYCRSCKVFKKII